MPTKEQLEALEQLLEETKERGRQIGEMPISEAEKVPFFNQTSRDYRKRYREIMGLS